MAELKKILQYGNIIESFFSLSLLNVINYIFPILLIPYLVRVLGVELYGRYIFAYTILNYFLIFIQYGFDFSGTKEIALKKDDIEAVNEIYSSIMSAKILFNILTILIIFILITLIPLFQAEYELYLYGLGIVVGNSLIPFWLFQGLEKLRFITMINFVSRFISLIAIFLFIKKGSQYELVMLLQSLGLILGAMISFILVSRILKVRFYIVSTKSIIFHIKNGWSLFLSTIGMSFYRESNIFILGLITNYTVVGYYSPVEKIIKGIQSMASPLARSLYPHFSRKMNEENDDKRNLIVFHKIGKLFAVILLIISVMIFVGAKFLLKIYLGEGFEHSVTDLRILSFVILLGGINFYYGIVGLVNKGYSKILAKCVWISGIVSIATCVVLSYYLKDVGAAISMVLAELLVFFFISYYIRKYL